MKALPFEVHKIEGAGNIFLAIDARKGSDFSRWESQAPSRPEMARRLCPLRALGADGLIFFSEGSSAGALLWDFYNADGSGAEMCGNAARCAGLFAKDILSWPRFPLVLETKAGAVSVSLLPDGRWSVEMPEILSAPREKKIRLGERDFEGIFVNTGVPHFVIRPPDGDEGQRREIARGLRRHVDFGSVGSNVTLLSGDEAVTFERGVEDFTAACGTGAVAAAVAMNANRPGTYAVRMPGGKLEVVLGGARPVLNGPAIHVAKIQMNQEILK